MRPNLHSCFCWLLPIVRRVCVSDLLFLLKRFIAASSRSSATRCSPGAAPCWGVPLVLQGQVPMPTGRAEASRVLLLQSVCYAARSPVIRAFWCSRVLRGRPGLRLCLLRFGRPPFVALPLRRGIGVLLERAVFPGHAAVFPRHGAGDVVDRVAVVALPCLGDSIFVGGGSIARFAVRPFLA